MNISDFNRPTKKPFNTFGRHEYEAFMWWFFEQCYDAGDLNARVVTKCNEDHMVEKGYLEKVTEQTYMLTTKSIGLLYSAYGKAAE